MEMLAIDSMSFNTVEMAGFRHFIEIVLPNYVLKSRQTFSIRILNKIYQKKRTKVKQAARNAKYVSLTIDA